MVRPAAQTRARGLITLTLLIGVLVFGNLLAQKVRTRIDFTAGGQYTMSEGTEEILSGMHDKVLLKFFVSEDVPTEMEQPKMVFISVPSTAWRLFTTLSVHVRNAVMEGVAGKKGSFWPC